MGSRARRGVGTLGAVLLVVGVLILAWAGTVALWNDPFTSLVTRWEQRGLADSLEQLNEQYASGVPDAPAPEGAAPTSPEEPSAAAIRSGQARARRAAARLHAQAQEGMAIGRIDVDRLDLNMVMVFGTTSGTLKRGPGADPRGFLPGEGNLVYVAGHRTTYAAPFAHIDRLRAGDRVRLEMPYGTFVYVVSGHSIVDAHDLSVLRSRPGETLALQACHPRFFATHRYIVWAKPAQPVPVGGQIFGTPELPTDTMSN